MFHSFDRHPANETEAKQETSLLLLGCFAGVFILSKNLNGVERHLPLTTSPD
jgi:hypothetical protein